MNNNYVKVALYAYPTLKTIGEDYQEHIQNMAILSYRGNKSAEELVEKIVETILEKEKLERLKAVVETVLEKLNEEERALIAIRYFGGARKMKNALPLDGWSESKYFRRQARLFNKVCAIVRGAGLTAEAFEREYAGIDIFERVYKFVADGKIGASEKKWLKGG